MTSAQTSNASLAIPTDAQYLAFLKEKLEGDFPSFVRYFFVVRKKAKFVFSDHHYVICDELMSVYRGDVTFLIVNIPPRYSKTELIVILFSLWCFIKNPRCEFIHLSYADALVRENSGAIRQLVKSFEFRQLWPHIIISPHKDATDAWVTIQGGIFKATTTGGQVTGFGAGRMDEWNPDTQEFKFSGAILIDDPLKPDDARHEALREGANRRWDETIKNRRNSPRTPVIVVMQRIHLKDFTAMLLQDSEFPWRHVRMNALIDAGQPTERALWPAKHTVADLEAMRDKKNDEGEVNPLAQETFSAQYQQDPTPAGGGLLKEHWWKMHDEPLLHVIDRCSAFIFTADTAYTEENANDASSIGFYGVEGTRRLTRLAEKHGRWEFPDLLINMVKFYKTYAVEGQEPSMLIEAKASGLSLIQTLRRGVLIPEDVTVTHYTGRSITLRAGEKVMIPAKPWAPKQYNYPDDKVGRVKESSWLLHGGSCWLMSDNLESMGHAPWVKLFKDETKSFTANDTHAADDRTDDWTMAVSWFKKYGGGQGG